MSIHRYPTTTATAEACGDYILDLLRTVTSNGASATLAISGGSSPRPMFERFGRTPFAWEKVHLFWVDDRVVPPTDAQSNYKLALDTWLRPGNFPTSNIHRVETELGPQESALRYQEEIKGYFHLSAGELPRFDVVHRGMGPDGHTASLFPGEPLIGDRTGLAAAVWVPKMNQWRVTLLPGVLEAARSTVMLVEGHDKASILREVLHGEYRPFDYPMQIAARDANVHWFLDQPAAAELPAD